MLALHGAELFWPAWPLSALEGFISKDSGNNTAKMKDNYTHLNQIGNSTFNVIYLRISIQLTQITEMEGYDLKQIRFTHNT